MKGRGKGGGAGFGGGMQQLMRQANQMQAKMKKLQEDLAEREYEASAADGAVKVVLKGESQVKAIKLDAEVVQPDDIEMLEDLLVTALNEALKTAKTESNAEMEKISGGMSIPGMF